MTTARRPRTPLVVIVVVVLAVVLGVIAAVLHTSSDSSSGGHSVAQLKSFAAKVPLPSDATLTDETSNEAHGDANSYLERDYRLADGPSTAQIKASLERGDCRLVDLHGGPDVPVDSDLWSSQTSADSGDVYVLPPGTKGGGVELNWQGGKLVLRVSGGDVESG